MEARHSRQGTVREGKFLFHRELIEKAFHTSLTSTDFALKLADRIESIPMRECLLFREIPSFCVNT